MTNVSTGNIDTHPESEKIKLIKAKKKRVNQFVKVCVSRNTLNYLTRSFSALKEIYKCKILLTLVHLFAEMYRKVEFFSIEILCVKSFSVRQYIASKDSLFSLIIMFFGY